MGPTSGVDCTSSFAHSNNERGRDRGKESSDEAKEEKDELRGRKTNKETGPYEYYYAFP